MEALIVLRAYLALNSAFNFYIHFFLYFFFITFSNFFQDTNIHFQQKKFVKFLINCSKRLHFIVSAFDIFFYCVLRWSDSPFLRVEKWGAKYTHGNLGLGFCPNFRAFYLKKFTLTKFWLVATYVASRLRM